MPWNGTGTFNRVYSWVTDEANEVFVRADRTDTDSNDIAAGISNCIARDGQAPPTANIPWGSRKITTLANGTAAGDAVNYGQVFSTPATFTTPSASATPTLGDSSTLLATTAFVAGTSFSAALPGQLGNAGKVLVTDGTTASWTALIRKIATLTPTAAATLDALSVFSSSYNNYRIYVRGVGAASGATVLELRLANAGVVDSGANYAIDAATTGTGGTFAYVSKVAGGMSISPLGGTFVIDILNANSATAIKLISVSGISYDGTNFRVGSNVTAYFASNAVSGFQLLISGGTNFVAQGAVDIYGYN